MEINLRHGDPVELADQVFLFKRTIREAALRHKMYATFMAKPIATEPGSAMHIHHSVIDLQTGRNIFADQRRRARAAHSSELHRRHADLSAARHVHAGALRELLPPAGPQHERADQRALGLRQPHRRAARAALRSGEPARREPRPLLRRQSLSRHRRLARLRLSRPRQEARAGSRRSRAPATTRISRCRARSSMRCGCWRTRRSWWRSSARAFVRTYRAIKETEYETFMGVISPWEREYLLLSV